MANVLQDPSDPFGGPFLEKGYTFAAFMPAGPHERTEFRVTVHREGALLFTVTVPMDYAPRFGVDVGDQAALEAATDRLINGLPPAADFTPDALDVFRTGQPEEAPEMAGVQMALPTPEGSPG